ncbi:MAG TPA: hypothetical protein VN782_14490 [Usitatibacter sp.]|nr:hypothetical protein [Usitatibacter sp.]
MSSSTLTPDNLPAGRDRRTGRGHGTEALGPSGSSDTGSDVQGAHGLAHDADRFGLDRGTNEDPDESRAADTGGPDIGDGDLDSDSDATGSGERAAAGRDSAAADSRDIDVDHIEEDGEDIGALEAGELDATNRDAGELDEGERNRPDLQDDPRNPARTPRRPR